MKEKADGIGGPTQIIAHAAGSRGWFEGTKESIAAIERKQFCFGDLGRATRQFFWSRFPHKFRPE
jgi:hypothetical protein